jgi:16S rRNA A1518/A1519 N6-dimethyltransferase RsmA/KsgA/DIM1 with predicted DNA glycosylase/AP lyase activity
MFENDTDFLDQHFLIDEKVINEFINICNFNQKDIVVEVGPGKGTLTQLIAPKVKELYVIEKDIRLKPFLDEIPNIKIIYNDVIKVNFPVCNKIITALPYSIIEPFIYKMKTVNFDELYMIMGSNYVNNVLNNKITNLSLLTNSFFDLTKYMDITPESFNPQPHTMSSLIKLSFKANPSKINLFFQNMYNLDEKTCKNAMVESLIKLNNLSQKASKQIINNLNIDENILNKKFNLINNEELENIYQKIFNLLDK